MKIRKKMYENLTIKRTERKHTNSYKKTKITSKKHSIL